MRFPFLPRQFLRFLGKRPIDKQFRIFRIARAFNYADAADFITRAFTGHNNLDRCAFFPLQRMLMQKADANGSLAACGVAGRGIAGLGILRDVFVQFLQIFEGLILAPKLNESGDLRISGAGTLWVSRLNFILVLRVNQILPAFRHGQIQFRQALGIDAKAENAQINRRRIIAFALGGIFQRIGNKLQIGRFIRFE